MTRTVYTDKDGHEMDVFVNDKGKLYISVGNPDLDMYAGYICLSKRDAEHLLKNITELIENYDLSEDD